MGRWGRAGLGSLGWRVRGRAGAAGKAAGSFVGSVSLCPHVLGAHRATIARAAPAWSVLSSACKSYCRLWHHRKDVPEEGLPRLGTPWDNWSPVLKVLRGPREGSPCHRSNAPRIGFLPSLTRFPGSQPFHKSAATPKSCFPSLRQEAEWGDLLAPARLGSGRQVKAWCHPGLADVECAGPGTGRCPLYL